jgi:hypothetical protein
VSGSVIKEASHKTTKVKDWKDMPTLMSATLEAQISASNFPALPYSIPSGHPAIASIEPDLKALAKLLGVDYDKVGYSYRAVKNKSGGVSVYGMEISNVAGVPNLVWGDVMVPVSELSTPLAIANGGSGGVVSEFKVGKKIASIPMKLLVSDGVKATRDDVLSAYEDGCLGAVLQEAIVQGKSLATIAPPKGSEPLSFKVIGVASDVSPKYGRKFRLKLDGLGWFKATTRIGEQLAALGEVTISETEPATLLVSPEDGKHNGYPIIPASLMLSAANSEGVFDFAA